MHVRLRLPPHLLSLRTHARTFSVFFVVSAQTLPSLVKWDTQSRVRRSGEQRSCGGESYVPVPAQAFCAGECSYGIMLVRTESRTLFHLHIWVGWCFFSARIQWSGAARSIGLLE